MFSLQAAEDTSTPQSSFNPFLVEDNTPSLLDMGSPEKSSDTPIQKVIDFFQNHSITENEGDDGSKEKVWFSFFVDVVSFLCNLTLRDNKEPKHLIIVFILTESVFIIVDSCKIKSGDLIFLFCLFYLFFDFYTCNIVIFLKPAVYLKDDKSHVLTEKTIWLIFNWYK